MVNSKVNNYVHYKTGKPISCKYGARESLTPPLSHPSSTPVFTFNGHQSLTKSDQPFILVELCAYCIQKRLTEGSSILINYLISLTVVKVPCCVSLASHCGHRKRPIWLN